MRLTVIGGALLLALILAGTALAQDGTLPGGDAAVPNTLDEMAARLMPLLVGAALIERTIEFLFNWVERAILDVSYRLNALAASVTGLVSLDLRHAWSQVNRLTQALVARQVRGLPPEDGNADSENPQEWPLAKLEAQLKQSEQTMVAAQNMIETALKSPEYVARKKMAASVLSVVFGIALAFVASLRLFEPLGVEVAGWFDGTFDSLDMVLAGALMGLGTDWVHQVIGLLIQGKGLLGRASGGSGVSATLDPDMVRQIAGDAIKAEFDAQLVRLREEAEQQIAGLTRPDEPPA
jgi:hypothetical protein